MPHPAPTRTDCACGGVLRCTTAALEAKREAVRHHNGTEQHMLWVAKGRPKVWTPEVHRRPSLTPEPTSDEVYEGRLLSPELSTGRPQSD